MQAGKTGKASHPTSNHGKAEAIYWDARRKAEALRWVPPPSTLFSTEFDTQDVPTVVRAIGQANSVWLDMHYTYRAVQMCLMVRATGQVLYVWCHVCLDLERTFSPTDHHR